MSLVMVLFKQNHLMRFVTFVSIVSLSLCSCKEMQYGSLTVSLKDGPADYQEVNVEIESVEVYLEGLHNPGWFKLSTNKGTYNLLQFQESTILLGQSARLPSGRVSQIRITFGSNNTLKTNDTFHSLRLPVQPGEKKYSVVVPAGFQLNSNNALNLVVDIDAERSVIKKSATDFLLDPIVITGSVGSPMDMY